MVSLLSLARGVRCGPGILGCELESGWLVTGIARLRPELGAERIAALSWSLDSPLLTGSLKSDIPRGSGCKLTDPAQRGSKAAVSTSLGQRSGCDVDHKQALRHRPNPR